jgi:hypothetical protein
MYLLSTNASLEKGKLQAALMMSIECEKEIKHNEIEAPKDVTFLGDQRNSELDSGEKGLVDWNGERVVLSA